jgi:hypothetical protein
VCLTFATALRCGSTNPAPPAPLAPDAPLPAAALAKSYGLALEPAPADGIPIRVVDAASRMPVADALVVSVDEADFTHDENDEDDADGHGSGRYWLRKLGRAYATAADGRVFVPAPTAPRSLFVWSSANFGRTTLEVHDHTEHVVALAPRSLRVEVVDRAGRPQAGVPIQMAKCSLEPMSIGTTVGVTGADGCFDIPALEVERGVHRSCGRRDLVMLGAPIFDGEMPAADAPVLEPVKFVLPECGSVEVELLDAQGRPLRRDSGPVPAHALALSVSSSGPAGFVGAESGARRPVHNFRVPFADGRCRLDHVELGADLQFWLRVDVNNWGYRGDDLCVVGASESETSHFRGPTRAGEVTHVVLRAHSFDRPDEDWHRESKVGEPPPPKDDLSDAATSDGAAPPKSADAPELRSSVDVAVKIDVPILPCFLQVRLDGNRDPNEHDSNPWVDVNGRATIRNVPAGSHSIEITRSGFGLFDSEVVLHESAEFTVAPSQHLRDPELLDIDLTGKLGRVHVDVVDDAGEPLSGFVHTTRASDAAFSLSDGFEHGRADLLVPIGDGFRSEVVVSRFRPLVLDPRADVRRVTMKRGLPIRLALAPGFELPDAADRHARLYVGVSEMPHFVPDRDQLRILELRPGAELHFELAEPGRWPLIFLIGREGANGEENVRESYLIDTTIDVEDRADEQAFVITPDPDCWNRLVGKLRARE